MGLELWAQSCALRTVHREIGGPRAAHCTPFMDRETEAREGQWPPKKCRNAADPAARVR